ncbi:MAG: hypothetical protein RIR62_3364, partial [Pseudomonadota bacterium]
MTQITNANFIFLGRFADIDPIEGNFEAESAGNLVGTTIGTNVARIVTFTQNDFGFDGAIGDNDVGTPDTFSYNLGAGSVSTKADASFEVRITATLTDGSARQIDVVMVQAENGDLFISDLRNVGTLDNLSINSIRIDQIINTNFSGFFTNQTVTGTTFGPLLSGATGVVDGEETAEAMGLGYNDANAPTNGGGDRITTGADRIDGNGGNDTIDAAGGNDSVVGGEGADSVFGNDGDDTLMGDGTIGTGVTGGPTTITPVPGATYTLLTWELRDITVAGTSTNPFPDSATGASTSQIAGGTFTLRSDAQPIAVGIIDGDTRFDDGDLSQDLSQTTTIDGATESGGDRFTPEYAYIVRPTGSTNPADNITIYAVEVDGNNTVGFVSDRPLEVGRSYTFISNVTNDPSIDYSAITNSFITAGGGIGAGTTPLSQIVNGSDTIDGGNGNDVIWGDSSLSGGVDAGIGAGNDLLRGGEGNDSLYGQGGNDTLDGGAGNDLLDGGVSGTPTVAVTRESFNWQGLTDAQIDSSVTQDTGIVNVTYTRTVDTGTHDSMPGTDLLNTTGINGGGEAVDPDSSLSSVTNGQGNTGAFRWEFSQPVTNVQFNINDIDGDGLVTLRAFDAAGNQIPVQLVGGAGIALFNNDGVAGAETADAIGPYVDPSNPSATVQVTIPGPVARIELTHTQNGAENSGINVTDIFYDVTTSTPGGVDNGADSLIGGEGNDTLIGNGGDDTLDGGTGADRLDGGAGRDSLVGGEGTDSLLGGEGSDTLSGGAGNDTLSGGANDDDLLVGAGDWAEGGDGDDEFRVDPALAGTAGVTVIGGEGAEESVIDPTNNPGGRVGDVLDLR